MNSLKMVKIYCRYIFINYIIIKCFISALKEYNACLIYNQKTNNSYNDSTKNKLLKRCAIVIKYLKNIQTIAYDILVDKSCKHYCF